MSRAGGTRYETVYEDRDRDYYRGGGGGGASRSRYNDVDVDVRTRDDYERRPRQPEFLREDYGRTNAGPVVLARDGDRRKPARDYEEEEILVKTKSRDKTRDPPARYRDEYDVDIRETESRRPERRRERDDVDVDVYEKRSAAPSRRGRDEVDVDIRESDTRSRTTRRDHDHDDIDINIRSTSRPAPPKRMNTEDIVFRRGEGERRRPTESVANKEDIHIRRDDHFDNRRGGSRERINIDIRETSRDRAPPRPRSNYDREEIDIRIREDEERRRTDDANRNTLVVRERSPSRQRRVASEREDYYFRRRSPSPPPRNEQEEIIIRRNRQRTPSPSPSPPRAPSPPTPEPMPELPPIIRPPIHQDVITHHRHIDHVRALSSKSSSPSPPPPPKRREPERRRDDFEVEIRRRDGRGGEEDIRIRDRDDDKRSRKATTVRGSSPSSNEKIETRSHRSRSQAAPRVRSRSRGQEKRERENFELSLEINNNTNDERRLVPMPPQAPPAPTRPKEMWTEVTKDLVSREAIEYMGYPYEETADFFYIMEYMRYEDVTRLVEISEDLHRDRRQRIEQIQWERQDPRLPEPRYNDGPRRSIEGPRDRDRDRRDYDERIYEREVIYEDGTRRRDENDQTWSKPVPMQPDAFASATAYEGQVLENTVMNDVFTQRAFSSRNGSNCSVQVVSSFILPVHVT
ncbi:MAG: hypothetical protein Q9159_002739 [Coniocarpon cinnabarinum]